MLVETVDAEPLDQEERRALALRRAEAEHRLKTSLAVVTGWAATLEDNWDKLSDRSRRDAVAVIRRVSDEMARETHRLLEQARVELLTLDLDPVRVDLVDMLRLTTVTLDGMSQHHHVVHEPAGGPVAVVVDPAALQQVLGHLIENAVKYSPEGGQVIVRALADIARQHAVLEVRDEGPGIPQGVDLFSPFTRGPGAVEHSGAGLGLYVVRSLCRSMGGEVEAWRNTDGPGSTFRVRLPLAD